MTVRVALLRGINVGRAKRIAMADLRSLIKDLGHTGVRTLLNSGNALFQAEGHSNREIASDLEAAIASQFGFAVPVLVLSNNELDIIVKENALPSGGDPSRLLVAFAYNTVALGKAQALLKENWEPESLAVGSKAAYLWCPDGIIQSRLAKAFSRATGDTATMRNWATVLKLQHAAGQIGG